MILFNINEIDLEMVVMLLQKAKQTFYFSCLFPTLWLPEFPALENYLKCIITNMLDTI